MASSSENSKIDIKERILSKVTIDADTGCWTWYGCKDGRGYGIISYKDRITKTHRIMYEYHRGPIPEGLQIDHLCCNRACCNPDHLEAVTGAENMRRAAIRRGNKCKKGHAIEGANAFRNSKKYEHYICRCCYNDYMREYHRARAAEKRAAKGRWLAGE